MVSLPATAQANEDPAVRIVQLYTDRAAHIQTIGELFTGELEVVATASGFLVADDLVITNNHAVPPDDGRYKSMRVDVRFASRVASARFGAVIARDPSRDLALVQVSPAVAPRPYCPVSALAAGALVPQGTRLYVLSYPLNEDLSVVDGLVSNKASDKKWMTNAALNVGTSGGAAFSGKGYLVGIAVGGITQFTNLDGERSPVFGVNYVIPVSTLVGSDIDATIQQRSAVACWNMLTTLPQSTTSLASVLGDNNVFMSLPAGEVAPDGGPTNSFGVPVDLQADEPPPPDRLSRSFTVSKTKDDHGLSRSRRSFSERFEAASGYRIDACSFSPLSANNESLVRCDIAADGRSALFTYRLTSGPFYDRWRGWLHGTVNLRQERQPTP